MGKYSNETVPSSSPSKKTVGELIDELSTLPRDLPVSLLIEFDSQYEDSLRGIVVATMTSDESKTQRVILTGLERFDPSYERANEK